MNRPTVARNRLNTFIDLLTKSAGLQIQARICHDPQFRPSTHPEFVVEITGHDSSLLLERDGELLHAIAHIASRIIRVGSDEPCEFSIRVNGFKAHAEPASQRMATDAVLSVCITCSVYTFPDTLSREQRVRYLALPSSGLKPPNKSPNGGQSVHRSVVLYPESAHPPKNRRIE